MYWSRLSWDLVGNHLDNKMGKKFPIFFIINLYLKKITLYLLSNKTRNYGNCKSLFTS